MSNKKEEFVPVCPKCQQPMNDVTVETILAPPAKPWTNKIWRCNRHDPPKKTEQDEDNELRDTYNKGI